MNATWLRNRKLGLAWALLLAASSWFYIQHILIPRQIIEAAAHDHPRGNLSDLYPRWLGARELLLHHRDPYSAEVTREIQAGYYGRVLDPARSGDPKDQQAFAYPAYVVFLLAPTILLPFGIVQLVFYWALWLIMGASVLLWLRAQRWRPKNSTIAALTVLTLGSIPVIQAIKLQQLTVVVAGLLAACAVLLGSRHFLSAGVVLALSTIKPQLVWPFVAWLVLWALSDWPKRARLIWGFASTMAILLVGAEYVLPGWMGRFYTGIAAYEKYTDATSILAGLTTRAIGAGLALAIVAVTAGVCWRMRRESQDSAAFAFVLALLLAVTVVVSPTASTYNQILLLPGGLLLGRNADAFMKKPGFPGFACMLAAFILFWPWLAALTLTALSLVLPPASVQKVWSAPLWSSLMTPVVVLLLLAPLAGTVLHEQR
jgi:glycosyl transferase family 87